MRSAGSRQDLRTLGELISDLDRFGEATALIAFSPEGVREVSFAALLDRSRRLAAWLAGRRVENGVPAAVFAPNSVNAVICRFGLILAGALTVPIDFDADAGRLHDILEDSGARRLFVASAFLDVARDAVGRLGEDVEIVLLDDGPGGEGMPRIDDLAAEPAAGPDRADPDAPVARFYTAGTTGVSKAVPLSHRNILTNLRILMDLDVVGSADRVVLPLPLHHAYPLIVGLLLPLASGAAVVFPAGIAGPDFVQAVREGGASIVVGVPRLYDAFVAGLDNRIASLGGPRSAILKSLVAVALFARERLGWRIGRTLLRPLHAQIGPGLGTLACGGARLDAAVEWRLEGLGYRVLTGYGLVETASIATFNRPGAARVGSAGRPSPGVEMRIVPVEEMDHGEIQFRGPIVFGGYADDPDANARAFADGWFRTGDLGWQDADGFLFISGRLKEVIPLSGGKNVAPGDVEAVYARSPYVEEFAVLERNDRLAGIVVPDMEALREAGDADIEQRLRLSFGELGRGLPGYMRIADFVVTREPLPRNPLGKYRRFRLPELFERAERGAASAPGALSDADRTRLASDRAVALTAWLAGRFPDSVLHPDTSLQMDLGIDSLSWLDLSLDLERTLGVRLSEEAIGGLINLRDLIDAVEAAETPAVPDETERARERERVRADNARWLAEPGPWARAFGPVLHRAARLTARIGFRLRTTGEPPPRAGRLIILANHLSDLDPLILGAAIPYPVLRRVWWGGDAVRVFGNRAGRMLARIARVFPVDDRAPDASLERAAEILERGRILVWFPEEWRSPDGALQRFRAGIGALVERTGADVLPVVIEGTFEAMPRAARLPRPRPVSIRFGRTIEAARLLADLPGDGPRARHRAIAQRLHEAMAEMLARTGGRG